MTKEQKRELAIEMLENMDLTKEQYIETCKLIDELDLMPENAKPTDPEDMDWDEILGES